MELVVKGKERSEAKPLILKLVTAGVLSFAGFIVAKLHSRTRPSLPSSSDGSDGEIKEEVHIKRNEVSFGKIIHSTATSTDLVTMADDATAVADLSPTSGSSRNEEEFLLPEFNNLVIDEFKGDCEALDVSVCDPLSENPGSERNVMEQEIVELKKLVLSLQESEESLKLQLLEYYGIVEQQATVKELENQLKVNLVEAKLHFLKIEALEAENQKLRAQLEDTSTVVSELEASKAKIKLLKKKLKSENEQRKEQVAFLSRRITMLQTRKVTVEDEAEIDRKLNDLVDQATRLKMSNSQIVGENLNMAEELERKESDAVEDCGVDVLEEITRLREVNEKLMKNIEQLQIDRCADVEELVYLRWVNACLRYELRNYSSTSGKTVASDLNKSSSPTSEEKAKLLILEYANHDADEKSLNQGDFDSIFSSSPPNFSSELEGTSIDASSMTHSGSKKTHSGLKRTKFLSKLKKLVLKKEPNSNKVAAHDRSPTRWVQSERRASISTCSLADTIGDYSCGSISSCLTDDFGLRYQLAARESEADERCTKKDVHYQVHSRHSLDSKIPTIFDQEGDEKVKLLPHMYKRLANEEDGFVNYSPDKFLEPEEVNAPEKVKLDKFANALKKSRGRINEKSASFRY